ncbi:MAG: toll/interleukin-1 receptor domain-containing protein [Pirellulales bacterium]
MDSREKLFDAFVSHSSKDRTYAELVCQSLESHSLRCWIAPRDIQPGVEWGAAIIDGIDRSKVMLVIFSNHANESAQVRREVERAIGKSMPILPFRIEDANPKGALEFALSNTHWLDAFKPPIEPTLTQLVRSVKALCSVDQSPTDSNATSKVSQDDQKESPQTQLTEAIESKGVIASVRKSCRSLLITSVLGIATILIAGFWLMSQLGGGEEETGEPGLVAKQPSRLSKEEFQKREVKKFLGRWVAINESTADGGKLPQKTVIERSFTITIRPNYVTHRRNPKLTETVTIRGDIQFEEGTEFDKFIFTGLDQDKVKQTFIGIYDFDGNVWRWCFRRSDAGGKLQSPLRMNTAGERNTYYVALKQVVDKGD